MASSVVPARPWVHDLIARPTGIAAAFSISPLAALATPLQFAQPCCARGPPLLPRRAGVLGAPPSRAGSPLLPFSSSSPSVLSPLLSFHSPSLPFPFLPLLFSFLPFFPPPTSPSPEFLFPPSLFPLLSSPCPLPLRLFAEPPMATHDTLIFILLSAAAAATAAASAQATAAPCCSSG